MEAHGEEEMNEEEIKELGEAISLIFYSDGGETINVQEEHLPEFPQTP